jgi:pyruvate dehydrogenase E2 component (dihydrolipoamide acetyltransferase)
MARAFRLPDLGEGLTEAEIVKVLVHEGDVVREDAPLLEVETDKAQVEIPSPLGGRVEKIHVEAGQTVKVGDVLVTFSEGGEEGSGATGAGEAHSLQNPIRSASLPRPGGPASSSGARGGLGEATTTTKLPTTPASAVTGTGPVPTRTGPVPATPATRRLARELGVDLAAVAGSGPGGRVTDEDVRAAAGGRVAATQASVGGPVSAARAVAIPGTRPSGAERVAKPLAPVGLEPPALPRFEQWGVVERQPLSHLRRTIAERMALSAALIPHVTHFDQADITDLDTLIRRNLDKGRERGITLTLTSFLLKAAALALREHPQFNASLDPGAGEMILKRYYHLGVAVATERGLIVPVIRDVDQKPLVELQRELASLATRVREGKATLEDLRGGSFTITNIGALGGTGAIPIINYPEVAILGVARAREQAVVRDRQIVPRLLLPISLTFDHRIADGADGARFASAIIQRLEAPERLFLEW